MMSKIYRLSFAFLLSILSSAMFPLLAANTAARDYLTPKEVEQVKLAQIIDQRIGVFIKAAERRLLVLANSGQAAGKQTPKDLEKWGDLPEGTRVELIMDVANILDAAITNIDDVAARDEKNRLIPKALRSLAAAVTRFQVQLASMRDQANDASERRALEQVMDNVREILSATGKLPPEEKKTK